MEILVQLSREELNDAKQAASMRWQMARMSGVTNQRRDDTRDDHEVDLLGIKAEMAVAKAYNLRFNPFSFGIDDGSDMFSGDLGIDVKASFHRDGKLIFKRQDAFRADVAVFVTGDTNSGTLRIAGWITKERFLDISDVMDMGGGKHAVFVPQKKLASPESLWAFLTNRRLSHA